MSLPGRRSWGAQPWVQAWGAPVALAPPAVPSASRDVTVRVLTSRAAGDITLSPPQRRGGGAKGPPPQLRDISEPRATATSWGPGDLLAGMGGGHSRSGGHPGVPVASCPPPTHRRAQSLFPRLKPAPLKSSAPHGAGANPPPGEKRGMAVRGGPDPRVAPGHLPRGGDTEGTRVPPTSRHPSIDRDTGGRSGGTPGRGRGPSSPAPGGSEPTLCPPVLGGAALRPITLTRHSGGGGRAGSVTPSREGQHARVYPPAPELGVGAKHNQGPPCTITGVPGVGRGRSWGPPRCHGGSQGPDMAGDPRATVGVPGTRRGALEGTPRDTLGSQGPDVGHWAWQGTPVTPLGSQGPDVGHWRGPPVPLLGSQGPDVGHWARQGTPVPPLGSQGPDVGHCRGPLCHF